MPLFMLFIGYFSAIFGYTLGGKTVTNVKSFYWLVLSTVVFTLIYIFVQKKKGKL